jgi:hypothetical protein
MRWQTHLRVLQLCSATCIISCPANSTICKPYGYLLVNLDPGCTATVDHFVFVAPRLCSLCIQPWSEALPFNTSAWVLALKSSLPHWLNFSLLEHTANLTAQMNNIMGLHLSHGPRPPGKQASLPSCMSFPGPVRHWPCLALSLGWSTSLDSVVPLAPAALRAQLRLCKLPARQLPHCNANRHHLSHLWCLMQQPTWSPPHCWELLAQTKRMLSFWARIPHIPDLITAFCAYLLSVCATCLSLFPSSPEREKYF